MISTVSLLKTEMEDAWDLVVRAVAGIDDKMLHWEPAPGSWGLRLKDGKWRIDHHLPNSLPPGPKTIGWLAAHLATCKEMYLEYAFGEKRKKWEDLIVPGDVDGLRHYLFDTHQPLKRRLGQLGGGDLEPMAPTNWGEEKPTWWIFWTLIYHDAEHAGQIIQLKNEYANEFSQPTK